MKNYPITSVKSVASLNKAVNLDSGLKKILNELEKQKLESLYFIDPENADYSFKYVVVCVCLSARQVWAIAGDIKKTAASGVVEEGDRENGWKAVFVPAFDTVFHCMTAEKHADFNISDILGNLHAS